MNASLQDKLRKFTGSSKNFLLTLLEYQSQLVDADNAFYVKLENGKLKVLATLNENNEYKFLLEIASNVLRSNKPSFFIHQSSNKTGYLLLPFPQDNRNNVAVFVVSELFDMRKFNQELLNSSFAFLDNYETKMTMLQRQNAIKRIYNVLDLNLVCNKKEDFKSYCYELCNEIMIRWQCVRVSLAFVKREKIKVEFISQMERFSRKMKLIRDLEDAMEESLDQDKIIVYPPIPNSRYIYRQAEVFSKEYDNSNVLIMPIKANTGEEMVILLEKKHDNSFTVNDVETLRLSGDLMVTRLVALHKENTLIKKITRNMMHPISFILGKDYWFFKILFLVVLLVIFALVFVKIPYYAQGQMSVMVDKQYVTFPFDDGMLEKVYAKKGDLVKKGDVLAELDYTVLDHKIATLTGEISSLQKDAIKARKEGNIAEERKITLEKENAILQRNFVKWQRDLLIIKSPIAGKISSEDLVGYENYPVEKGKVLFEIVDLNSFYVEALIDEDQIIEVTKGDKGVILTKGKPDIKIAVEVVDIYPVAEVHNQNNIFRLKMKITEKVPDWLYAGMEGECRIKIDKRSIGFVYGRDLINWFRMKLWL